MKVPNLDRVRLLKPRLGFGDPDVCTDCGVGGAAEAAQIEEEPSQEDPSPLEDTQLSLLKMGEQLEMEALAPPALHLLEAPALDPDPSPEPEGSLDLEPSASPSPAPDGLQRRKIAAIGFGRQDIAGLAIAFMTERARIEFLPHGEMGAQGEFDLYLLNCSSAEVLKREASSLRRILASGTPSIVIGSRAALGVLRASGDPRTWDFAAKPLHLDELVWRAANLIARCEELAIPKKLPLRVVIADNDPFTRSLLESTLKSQGFTCHAAEDGEAARSAIEKMEPGVVILDLTLPNRDGFQLMADIRRSAGRKPKVMVLSARQSEADILRAFSLGADDYITKPFSPLELHARLTRLVGGLTQNA